MSKIFLPPLIDKSKHIYAGKLTLSIGKLINLNKANINDYIKIIVIFWGQEKFRNEQINLRFFSLFRTQESNLDYKTEYTYTICVDQQNFERYLKESKKIQLIMLDDRNDTLIGTMDYDLSSQGEKICTIKKKTEDIGKIKIKVSINYEQQDQQTDLEEELNNWSHSYKSNEYRNDELLNDTKHNFQVKKSKEKNIDQEKLDQMFEDKGMEIHQNLHTQNQDKQQNSYETPIPTLLKPMTANPDLERFSNDIDMAKLKQTDTTVKQQIQQNIQISDEKNVDSLRFIIDQFKITDQKAQAFIKDKQFFVQVTMPNESKFEMVPKSTTPNSFQIQQELPYVLELTQPLPQEQLKIKVFLTEDKRELANAVFSIQELAKTVKASYNISLVSQIPFDRMNSQNPGQPTSPSNEVLNAQSNIGEIIILSTKNQKSDLQIQLTQNKNQGQQMTSQPQQIQSCFLHVRNCSMSQFNLKFIPFSPPALKSQEMDENSTYTKQFPLVQKEKYLFILEFWQQNQILGLYKNAFSQSGNIDAKSGRVIEDGTVEIKDFNDDKIAEADLILVIGNHEQIEYWEKKIEKQRQIDEKIAQLKTLQQQAQQQEQNKQSEKVQEEQVRKAPDMIKQSELKPQGLDQIKLEFDQYRNQSQVEGSLLQTLVQFLEDIRRVRDRYNQKINYMFTSDDVLSQEKFIEFIRSFQTDLSDAKIGQLLKIFDYYNNKEVEIKDLGMSYGSYFKYESIIRDKYENLFRNLMQLFGTRSREIKQQFYRFNDLLIDSKCFSELLKNNHVEDLNIKSFVKLMILPDQNDLIFYPQFWEYQRQLELHQELKYLQPNSLIFIDYYNITQNYLPVEFENHAIDLIQTQGFLKDQQKAYSRFDALLLINNIDQAMKNDMKVGTDDLLNYIKNKQEMDQSQVIEMDDGMDDLDEIQRLLNIKQDEYNEQLANHEIHESSISGVLDPKLIDKTDSNIADLESKVLQNVKINPSVLISQYLHDKKDQLNQLKDDIVYGPFSYINHNFKISIKRIFDFPQKNSDDSYCISYQFPSFDKMVDSSNFVMKNLSEREIQFKSNHFITLNKQEYLSKYFANYSKGICVFLNKKYPNQKTIASSMIPIYDMYDLFEKIDYETFKVKKNKRLNRYVLFENSTGQSHGILDIKISFSFNLAYSCEPQFSSVIMQKEQCIQKMLPKEGIIMISFQNIHFLKCQPNEPYFTYLRCDFFHLNKLLPQIIVKSDRIKNDCQYDMKFRYIQEIKLNQDILEYFKNNSCLIQFIAETNNKTEVLGSTKLSLIDLITNNNGIQGDLPIFSDENIFVGSFRTHIKYDEKPLFEMAQQDVHSSIMVISFGSLLNYLQPTVSFNKEKKQQKMMYFSWHFECKKFITPTFIYQNDWKSIKLTENLYLLKIEDISQVQEDLEIKLFVKNNQQDVLFAFAKINLQQFLNQGEKRLRGQNYFSMIGADSSQPIKLRVGLVLNSFSSQITELDSKFKFLDMIKEKSYNTYSNQEKIQIQKLNFDLNDFQFQKFIKEIELDSEKVYQNIYKELSFFDYDNSGFQDFEDSKRILILFESQIQDINTAFLSQFKQNNIFDINQNQYRLQDQFDMVQFLDKLIVKQQIQPQPVQKKNYTLLIKKGLNFQYLNNNIPPNSFLIINEKKTQFQTRQQNPLFNEQTTISDLVEIKVGHSMYSRLKSDSIRQEHILASAFIEPILGDHLIELQYQGKRTNAFLEIQIYEQQSFSPKKETVENFNEVYQNIEKTLNELNYNMKASKEFHKPLVYESKISKQNFQNITPRTQMFGSTLEKLSALNIEIEQNFQPLESFTMDRQKKIEQSNPFQNHIDVKKDSQENYEEEKDKVYYEQQMKRSQQFDLEVESKLISESSFKNKLAFPSLQKSISFKQLEEKLKISNQGELDRISKIMKQDFSKSMKLYDLSSDSD